MEGLNYEFISKLFPFLGIEKNEIKKIFSTIKYSVREFSKNSTVFSEYNDGCDIGFIISGECSVARIKATGERISLNTLGSSQSFGILKALEPGDDVPTDIIATKQTKILFINGTDFNRLIETNSSVSANVIRFLVKKIKFLNGKVETFSGSNTSEKLASYLLDKFYSLGREFSIPRTKICSEINVGRASLYRDLDDFSSRGLISTNGKNIIIICPEGLERIIK